MKDHLKVAPVVVLPVVTTLDLPTQRVVQAALDAELQSAVVMGWDANGELYFASTMADGGDVLWLMEKCKVLLLAAGGERGN